MRGNALIPLPPPPRPRVICALDLVTRTVLSINFSSLDYGIVPAVRAPSREAGSVGFPNASHSRLFSRIFCATVIAQLCPNRILICALRPDLRAFTVYKSVVCMRTGRRTRYYAPCASTTAKRKIPLRRVAVCCSYTLPQFLHHFFVLCAPLRDARRVRGAFFSQVITTCAHQSLYLGNEIHTRIWTG